MSLCFSAYKSAAPSLANVIKSSLFKSSSLLQTPLIQGGTHNITSTASPLSSSLLSTSSTPLHVKALYAMHHASNAYDSILSSLSSPMITSTPSSSSSLSFNHLDDLSSDSIQQHTTSDSSSEDSVSSPLEDILSGGILQIKRTYQPSLIRRKRKHGFLNRMQGVKTLRKVLENRKKKGRKILSA
jgi:large subunit ribosomal protein L34